MASSESDSSNGSSFASSDGGSIVASDNTDSRALNALNSGDDDGNTADDLDTRNKSVQEGLYATIYTLTKNKTLEASRRLAVLKVVVVFLQLFRVFMNSAFPWKIQTDRWIFQGIQWLLLRMVVMPKGYDTYITVFYALSVIVLASLLAAVLVAVFSKGSEHSHAWVKRLVSTLQLFSWVIYTLFWPACLDFLTFVWHCEWPHLAEHEDPHHNFFPAIGIADSNPLTKSILASSDAATSFKILALQMIIVMIDSMLDSYGKAQIVIMLLAVAAICFCHIRELPYYHVTVNLAWTGLWTGLLLVASLLTGLEFTKDQHADDPDYRETMTWAVLYGIFPAVALGAAGCWLRVNRVQSLSAKLHQVFEQRKAAVILANSETGVRAGAAGASVVGLFTELRQVYRFKDVRQVSLLLRTMRVWDEDGVPDPDAAEFGEFILKCGMVRMPNDPALLVMYANYLMEVRKDGQAARTQMQLAQKANPTMLDSFNIHVAQQLSKSLNRDGDGLDLLSYVEFQRNYRVCVRAHRIALMAQRQFWNSLLRDNVSFKDLQSKLEQMQQTEEHAAATYKHVLERYPGNGKLLKVYGHFLEFVRNDPWTAAKFYEAALKNGTTESMLAMTAGQAGTGSLTSVAGTINEKTDGLVIMNAQGIVLMVNAAVLGMFGYEKGELEGKNVSVLMPPPFSNQHNTFVQRYVDSGVPHIANTTRSMVALHKNHLVFPLTLCATRLSGVGSDTLFMGLLRRLPAATVNGQAAVRFWTTSGGIILCTDRSTADSFGLDAATLIGQPFCNLCTDEEGVNKFISSRSQGNLTVDNIAGPLALKMQTQMMHSYLPPVDVELSIAYGGALDSKSDCRILCVQACVLSESAATLVLDHKARVVYATDKLCVMLGYPITSLLKMELNALLPQPYCQMHGAWFTEQSLKPSPNSCRAGGVVSLLAASGTKVPVTLKITARENSTSGKSTHVVQVTKVVASQQLDQRRLLVLLNHKSDILEVNQGAQQSLFGFEPSEVVGRPLAAIVDVFGLWRHQYGEDGSLLAMLAAQAMECQSASRSSGAGGSWRVGVHLPTKCDADIGDHAARLAAGNQQGSKGTGVSQANLLHLLQQRIKLHGACMSLEVLQQEDNALLLDDDAVADVTPVAQVSLFRADSLSSVLELDKHMTVVQTDDAAGLIFGISSRQLHKRSFTKLIGLPSDTTFDQLLGTKAPATARKGAMKAGAGTAVPAASCMGQEKQVTARHLGDGQHLKLKMQAMSYKQAGKVRMLVRLQLHEPGSASMPGLLQLKDGIAGALNAALAEARRSDHTESVSRDQSRADAGSTLDSECPDAGAQSRAACGVEPAHIDSFARTSDWVREQSQLPRSENVSPTHHSDQAAAKAGKASRHVSKGRGSNAEQDYEDEFKPSKGKRNYGHSHKHSGILEEEYQDEAAARVSAKSVRVNCIRSSEGGKAKVEGFVDEQTMAAAGVPGSVAESASAGGGASVGDAASEAAGSISSATDNGHVEDLAVDARRAKHLKKLNRMLLSNAAQQPTSVWKRHTLALLAVILAVHVACFGVIFTQIDSRHQNAEDVAQIARGLDRFQAITLRTNFLTKCALPAYVGTSGCDPASLQTHLDKLIHNAKLAQQYHQDLFLGSKGLDSFADPRLLDNWTYHPAQESIYLGESSGPDGLHHPMIMNSTRTLWSMGNVMISAAFAVADRLKTQPDLAKIRMTLANDTDYQWAWHYISLNGPQSIFFGYYWSLDIFTDYTWKDLTKLSVTLIVLLVVEALIIQLGCITYEFYLLQRCNVSHMRLFSVFLALPSATVRLMAQRQLQIDDDNRDELEDDDMELADAAGVVGAGAGAFTEQGKPDEETTAAEKKQKFVRMHVEEGDKDDNWLKAGSTVAENRSSTQNNKSTAKAALKKQLTGFAGLKHRTFKHMFGWLDPKFKRNGKKLVPSSLIIWKFIVPLLLWVTAVAIIFGVSYTSLQGLNGPLASLDTAAHVLFRISRCRLFSNLLAYASSADEIFSNREMLRMELAMLRQEYAVLLYGGDMQLFPGLQVSFNPVAPASAFSDSNVAGLFFRTTACLRQEKSACIEDPSNEMYAITHAGLDALLQHYMDEMQIFVNLPDELSSANHSSYVWAMAVAGNDMYDGMQSAADLFVNYMISRLESVKQLHIILLVVSLACMVLFLVVLYQPYMRRLKRDSKAVAGLLSQLPAEVDVDSHVRTIVCGMTKPAGGISSMIADRGTAAGMGNFRMGVHPYWAGMMGSGQMGQMIVPGSYGAPAECEGGMPVAGAFSR